MFATIHRLALGTALCSASVASAQLPPPPALSKVEPGLERAVRWKWHVEPSPAADWGLPVIDPPRLQAPAMRPELPGATQAAARPGTYVVQRGDALIRISKRFKVPLDLLKKVNGLESDMIRAGQELRIPSPEEIAAANPAPRVTPGGAPASAANAKTDDPLGLLRLQVFLDRANFSPGPIDGENSLLFQAVRQLYLGAAGLEPEALKQRAETAIREPLAHYTLRPRDFAFIAPPKAQPIDRSKPTPTPSKKKDAAPAPTPPPTFEDLTTARFLAYRSPWAFVAERFHCDESYLRRLNSHITQPVPAAGTEFRVPNVEPFEIERALVGMLQPLPDSAAKINATIQDLQILEIRRGDQLIAAMPVSIARPGLRGKSDWLVLDAIPRPCMVTDQERRNPVEAPTRIYGRESPDKATPAPTPEPEQLVLGPGPANPVGVVWINLALASDPQPLSFGLHGTSNATAMAGQQSLGGIRMANWDIVRAARLLPRGTPLAWAQGGPPMRAPQAAPAVAVP